MKRRTIIGLVYAGVLICTVFFGSNVVCAAEDKAQPCRQWRWSKEKAWDWYRRVGEIRGCNYLPRTAVNSTEMWQAGTFDPNTIRQELGWARSAGYNSVRVFLQYVVWEAEPEGFKKRLERFLRIAAENAISVVLTPFCDCAFAGKEPYLGKQDDPIPGVHNSQWVPSPGHRRVVDRRAWPGLRAYIEDIVRTFGQDRRVLMWDLYNEPGNSGMGTKSLPLVKAAFGWARGQKPKQPLTVGLWRFSDDEMSASFIEMADVLSFHAYDAPQAVEAKIRRLKKLGRPLICTEWLRRQVGNDFRRILPLFAEHQIGWYNWGLVAGRTQTYMPWGSKEGDPEPELWQHDVFRADGRAFDVEEIRLIHSFAFKK